MRRLPLPVLLVAVTSVAAPLWGSPLPAAPVGALDVFSGIDFVPGRADLDRLFAGNVSELVGVANGVDGEDPGIRLRAYRSLAQFDGDPVALAGLRDAVARYRSARQGTEVLYLMAAVHALGVVGDASDVATLSPLLGAGESRDLRAAAARALGALGGTAACSALRAVASDPVAMVKLAVNRAIHQSCVGTTVP